MSNVGAAGWPSGQPDGWLGAPGNLLPAKIEGWPAGTQRAASEAEVLLSQAVAWWDPTVSGFRDGDRWLRNSGTAGGLLDLRLGSSTVANTNDPKWLGPEDTGYAYLPGVSGPTKNNLVVPDEAALDITSDVVIAVKVAADDWTPSELKVLLAKEGATSGTRGYLLYLATTGRLVFTWSTDGTNANQFALTSTAAPAVNDGEAIWVKVAFDADNGASGRTAKFYTSNDGTSWTQLGLDVTSATATSINANSANLGLGAWDVNSPNNVFSGRIYRAIVWSDLTETTKVLDVDCDAITTGSATSFTATTGQTVTINRSTSGRKTVAMPAKRLGGRACFLFGTDDYMEVVDNWQHQLLNFGQGDSFTVLAVVRAWNTMSSVRAVVSKWITAGGVNAGWQLGRPSNFARVVITAADGSLSVNATGTTDISAGALATTVGVINRRTGTAAAYVGANVDGTSTVNMSTLVSTYNALPLRVGAYSNGLVGLDMEFTAAAIFRRALTAREIASITAYYGAS